ncbi:DUF5615 family PIN-like protein [candidate division KSB1 bacterium]|nr:DUF5615 family PIN-like protein [candidate division KSB1 bacterium]
MGKKFFADECTFGMTVRLIRELGFEVVRAQDLGMVGFSDAAIFAKAQQTKAVLITNDQDFADIRQYPPTHHYGIIVLKILPEPEAIKSVHAVLKVLLLTETDFHNTLFIVDRFKYRKRKPSK